MALETTLYNALKGLVNNRVFPDIAPTGTALPYITWQQIGGAVPDFVENTVPSTYQALIQVNAWDASRNMCNTLARQIQAAMIQINARAEGAFVSDYDPDTENYGTSQDFKIDG